MMSATLWCRRPPPSATPCDMRNGFSLIELVTVMVIVGILVGLGAPSLQHLLDRIAVDRAANELTVFYHGARLAAVLRGRRVRIEFHPDSLLGVYEGLTDSTFLNMPGPSGSGVTLAVSRATIRIQPNGFGMGAANTKLVLRRGAAADSLAISRLGRIRRIRQGR